MQKANIAKVDTIYTIIPNMFTPLAKNQLTEKQKETFSLTTYQDKTGRIIKILKGNFGIFELRIFLAIIALAGLIYPHIYIIEPDTTSTRGKVARKKLELKGFSEQQKALVLKTSYSEILRTAGLKEHNYNRVKKAIELLGYIKVTLDDPKGKFEQFNFLNETRIDNSNNDIFLSLNPRTLEARLFDSKNYKRVPYAYIILSEIFNLSTQVAQILNFKLAGFIFKNSNNYTRRSLKSLYNLVYREPLNTLDRRTRSKRLKAIKQALKELNSLKTWIVEEYAKDCFKIKRVSY